MSPTVSEEKPASLYNLHVYANVLWRIALSIGLIALAVVISS